MTQVRILDHEAVRRLLPMRECIDVMAGALASLARGEVHNPLRFVVRPPDEPSLLGLMPAHRAGSELWGLKTVAIFPGNSARGLDSHQGFVALFDGETGEPRTVMNAGAITSIRTAAVSGVATRLLAREDAKVLAILGAGIQERPTSRRCARCTTSNVSSSGAGRPDACPASTRCDCRGGRARCGRDRHRYVGGRADPRARLAEARRAHQRGGLEHPDDARARHGDDARRGALRRPARVDGQRGGRLSCSRSARVRSAPSTSGPRSASS